MRPVSSESAGHLDDATACSQPRSTAVNESGIAAEAAATRAGGGRYVDLTDLFCTADRCPVIVGNTMVYFDWTHVAFEYSRRLAPVIQVLADRELAGGWTCGGLGTPRPERWFHCDS
jgi:hypothetical protein